MTINDKIKQILLEHNYSPSYFADEIGVQRSSISHILSGRNRPSFDIIQKIIRRFPELGYDWIMTDEEESSSRNSYHLKSKSKPPNISASTDSTATLSHSSLPITRQAERIVIFYTDGSFEEFQPKV